MHDSCLKKILLPCLFLFSSMSVMAWTIQPGDRVVFLGDSITEGATSSREQGRADGWITLLGKALKAEHDCPVVIHSIQAQGRGFPASTKESIVLINSGIGGHRVHQCLARVQEDVLAANPTKVFIKIGTNDTWTLVNRYRLNGGHPIDDPNPGNDPDTDQYWKKEAIPQFTRDLKALIDAIQAQDPLIEILLATPAVIQEIPLPSHALNPVLDHYAGICETVAEEKGIAFLNVRKAFVDELKPRHPGRAAYWSRGHLTPDAVHFSPSGNYFFADLLIKRAGLPGPYQDPAHTPPTVNLEVKSGNPLTLRAEFSDKETNIREVEFFQDGESLEVIYCGRRQNENGFVEFKVRNPPERKIEFQVKVTDYDHHSTTANAQQGR